MDDFFSLMILLLVDIFIHEKAKKRSDWKERARKERKWAWIAMVFILVAVFLFTYFYS